MWAWLLMSAGAEMTEVSMAMPWVAVCPGGLIACPREPHLPVSFEKGVLGAAENIILGGGFSGPLFVFAGCLLLARISWWSCHVIGWPTPVCFFFLKHGTGYVYCFSLGFMLQVFMSLGLSNGQ